MNTKKAAMTMAILLCTGAIAHGDFFFGEPVNLGPVVNSPANEEYPSVSADGLSLYFDSGIMNGTDVDPSADLFVTQRKTVKDDWEPPARLGPNVNSPDADWSPHISADGLELYFTSQRPGGYGRDDLWVAKRASPSDEWGTPVNLGSKVNTDSYDCSPCLSQDGLTLYLASGWRLYVSYRKTKDAPWEQSTKLGIAVQDSKWDLDPAVSPDGLVLVFCSELKLWMATRRTVASEWAPRVQLNPVSTYSVYGCPSFSPDGQTLFLVAGWPGGYGRIDIWQSPIIPICDFNGDGKVDGKEVLALAQHWGQNESLYDIGLSPIGDGVIDTNDLTALARYIGQEVNDPTLIAHWALDETEGMTAADSARGNDALVFGSAVWQADGKIGGALAFDGKIGFAQSGESLLDPAKGPPFSVIAWVKGTEANRVIVSQATGADWLYLNQYGMLTTDLKSSGKDGKTLTSDAYILDDQWHRVALTWDGTNRTLQMDGVEVARDTQTNLKASSGKLLIGAGKTAAPTSFWTGLIDDVRVYNRAVAP